VLREFLPANIGTHNHRDLVMHLSGQLAQAELTERASAELSRVISAYNYPPAPWFPPGAQFVDYSSHEMAMLDANARDEDQEKSAFAICAARGVQIRLWAGKISDGVNAIRYLLRQRRDGTFGLYVDPACTLLVRGLGGGIQYKKATPLNPVPNDPARDGVYEHLHDALRYAIINYVDINDPLPEPEVEGVQADPRAPVRYGRGSYEARRARGRRRW
jgi:hypothetical protein